MAKQNQEQSNSTGYTLQEGQMINTSGKGDDPVTGTYDFGPRVGKVSNLRVNGRPATREEALQVLRQSSGGFVRPLAEEQAEHQNDVAEFVRGQEPDRYMRNALRDILPMAAFPELSELGFIKSALAAGGAGAAGGELGELADRFTGADPGSQPKSFMDWLGRRASDAAFTGGLEMGGRTIGSLLNLARKPAEFTMGGMLQNTPRTLREDVNKTFGIHFTPAQVTEEASYTGGKPLGSFAAGEESRAGHNPYSRRIIQTEARNRGMAARSAVQGLANQLGPDVPTNITGRRMAEVIEGVGKPTWSRQVSKLKSIVDAKAHRTMVDVTSLKDEANRELEELAHQRTYEGHIDEDGNPMLPSTAKVKMLTEIANFPDQMPFSALATKRSDWMGVGPQMTELISGEAKGTAKHYTQLATGLLDEAAKGKTSEFKDPFFFSTPEMTDGSSRLHTEAYKEALAGGDKDIGTRAEAIRKQKVDAFINEYANEVRNVAAGLDPTGQFTSAAQRQKIAEEALPRLQNALKQLEATGVKSSELQAAMKTEPHQTLERAQNMVRDVLKRDLPKGRIGGFEQDWNRFRNFTRKGADVFESKTIVDAVNKNPEDFVSSLKGDDISDILRVRRAIKGYGETYGTVRDKLKSMAAWRKFQTSYLRDNVIAPLDGNMTNLYDALEKLSPAVKKAIWDDRESQQTLMRLTQIAKAMKDADKGLGVLMGHQDPLTDLTTGKGWFRSIRPFVVSKIAWNPTATRFFLRGLQGLSEAPPTDNKLKDFVTQTLVGKGSRYALKASKFVNNRRLGAAVADILRAYDLANINTEAKLQKKLAHQFLHHGVKMGMEYVDQNRQQQQPPGEQQQ